MSRRSDIHLEPDAVTDAEFARIAGLVRSMTGIDLQPHKRAMVAARLAKRLRATGIPTVKDYCDQLENGGARDEVSHFINAYTTNMTRFNREEHHFQHLAEVTLPPLIAKARAGGRVRLWSTACSSGEEPYGLAFHILDLCPDAHRFDIKILATDIDLDILERAVSGIYPAISADTLSSQQSSRYLEPAEGRPDAVSVCEDARRLITFRQLNLHAHWPFSGCFDIIICRNVCIYFDQPTQSALWRRFAENLERGGHLYIGHSEGIDPDNAQRFETVGRGVFQVTDFGTQRATNSPS